MFDTVSSFVRKVWALALKVLQRKLQQFVTKKKNLKFLRL